MLLQNLLDIHTHHSGRSDSLLSLPSDLAMRGAATPFSLQLHPWHLGDESTAQKQEEAWVMAAERLKGDGMFMAVGECGLDNMCQVPLEIQLSAFRLALSTAADLRLPVIIHCVGYWAEMMHCVKEYYPLPLGEGWGTAIIHGYRKGPQLARQLLDRGFSISLGEKFNPEVARLLPDDRLYFETDESESDIWTIRQKILSLRG